MPEVSNSIWSLSVRLTNTTIMNRENTLDSIPIDLFLEIFSRLPTKSVGRCRCVSKQWASFLGRQDFIELFLTRSSTRPRLLFALKPYGGSGEWFLYSSPQHQNPYEKSIVVAAYFHTKFPESQGNCIYASGLFCFPAVRISKNKGEDASPVICNPSTGHCAILPKLKTDIQTRNYLGFDPIDKQFKVREIQVLRHNLLVSSIDKLYKGKLGGINLNYASNNGFPLNMWVLKDVEKQEWSKYVYSLCAESKVVKVNPKLSVVGMTATGDIVFSGKFISNPFYVFYFNPERNTLLSVEIKGLDYRVRVSVFVDHVEDLNVYDTKQFNSSIYAHLQQDRGKFESSNKFDAMCLSDDD